MRNTILRIASAIALLLTINACRTANPDAPALAAMNAAIHSEKPGNYFIARRMYKVDYKFWGWIREPGKPWTTARLVMLNEQTKLAPDREHGKLGIDNNHVYRFTGRFSGETVYEPASDAFYPEFVLTGYELITTKPESIYITKSQEDPAVRILVPPVH